MRSGSGPRRSVALWALALAQFVVSGASAAPGATDASNGRAATEFGASQRDIAIGITSRSVPAAGGPHVLVYVTTKNTGDVAVTLAPISDEHLEVTDSTGKQITTAGRHVSRRPEHAAAARDNLQAGRRSRRVERAGLHVLCGKARARLFGDGRRARRLRRRPGGCPSGRLTVEHDRGRIAGRALDHIVSRPLTRRARAEARRARLSADRARARPYRTRRRGGDSRRPGFGGRRLRLSKQRSEVSRRSLADGRQAIAVRTGNKELRSSRRRVLVHG